MRAGWRVHRVAAVAGRCGGGAASAATWKRAADFVFTQVSYAVEEQLRWRDANPVDVPVYAGVMVLASAGMAQAVGGVDPGY